MAKRLIDTDIFKKDFLRGMEAPYKLLWIYIINDCNHAGVWDVELPVAQIRLGVELSKNPVSIFTGKIIPFQDGKKWFIPSFIEFQYGKLNPANKAHNSVIQILQRYDLLEEDLSPIACPLEGHKDMDKDKELDKEKEKTRVTILIPTEQEFLKYGLSLVAGNDNYSFSLKAKYQQWKDNKWRMASGKQIKNWKNAIQNTIPHLKPFKPNGKTENIPFASDNDPDAIV